MFLFKVCFLRELRLDSPRVTLSFSLKIYIFLITFFHNGPKAIQQNCNSKAVFFFVLSLVTVFDFAVLRELQNRPWKTSFIGVFGVIISEHLVKCIFSWLSPWPMILLFVLTFFTKIFYFLLKKNYIGIFLEFSKTT